MIHSAFNSLLLGCSSAVLVLIFASFFRTSENINSYISSKSHQVNEFVTIRPLQSPKAFSEPASPSESPKLSHSLSQQHEPNPTQFPRVALAVKVTARHAIEWGHMISALPFSTRANLTIFLTVYGDLGLAGSFTSTRDDKIPLIGLLHNASSLFPATVAYFAPTATTTWTSGRNELLQLMYAHEVERGEQFTYWVTADGDASHNDCTQCPPTRPPDYTSAACCWDTLLGPTLNSDGLAFAMVGTTLATEELPFFGEPHRSHGSNPSTIRQYFLRDCTDGQTMAFHRDAVPLILPFHEEMDHQSWWASQALLFAYSSACLRGGCAVLEGNIHIWDNEHFLINRNSPDGNEMNTLLERKNPQLWGHLIIPERQCAAAEHIRNNRQDNIIYLASGDNIGETVSNIQVAPRVRWNETCAFSLCKKYRHANFIDTVGKGVSEAPRRSSIKVGWVWGWQALPNEPLPYWSDNTKLSGFSKDCV